MEDINLAKADFGTRICCDSVSHEEFPLSNLIQCEAKGFMADYFIRAPITITLHLPFPIVLKSLSWATKHGTQSSTLHEVLTSVDPGAEKCSRKCHLSQSIFWPVGKGTAANGSISFTNRRVSSNAEGYRLGCKDNWEALNKVRAIRIKILRTERNSVPCMKNLKVFGISTGDTASTSLENEVIAKSKLNNADKIKCFNFFGGEIGSDERASSNEIMPAATTHSEDLESIPTEFLDAITYDMMLLPMTLPSGHNVDRTTIEKCQDSFASWGGQPRDPFTGKLFTEKLKPVFNAGLKSRIDLFLLNSNKGKAMAGGRTLGSAQKIEDFLKRKDLKRKLVRSESNLNRYYCSSENQENAKSNKIICIDSSDEEESCRSRTTDLDKALAKTLSQVKPILEWKKA